MGPQKHEQVNELLEALSTKYREQEERQFPDVDLPQEYDDLYAEWVEMDGFVAGLAMRALAGERLLLSQVTPIGYDKLRPRLDRLRREFPELAPSILETFRLVDGILALLKSIIELQETEFAE